MMSIPAGVRVALAAVGVVSTFLAMYASVFWLQVALCGVALLGFTTSIDWAKPVPSAAATAASGIPVGLGSILLLDYVNLDANPQVVFTLILVGFFVTACFAWAVAGFTFRSAPKRRWWIALGASAVIVVMVIPSLFVSTEPSRVMTPAPYSSVVPPLGDVA